MNEHPKDSKHPPLNVAPFFDEPKATHTWWRHALNRLPGSCLVSALVLLFVVPALIFVAGLVLGWLVKE